MATKKQRPVSKHTLRLTYEYDSSGTVRLVSARRVEMVPPPPNDLSKAEAHERSGFWYEVRGDSQAVLYRRIIEHPIAMALEAPAEDEHSVTHGDVGGRSGEFTLLVPELDKARSVVLLGSTADRAERPEARVLIDSSMAQIYEGLKR